MPLAVRGGLEPIMNAEWLDQIEADLYGVDAMAEEIMAFTGQDAATVYRSLSHELHQTGWNIRRECARFGVTPHQFDEAMLRLYHESEGFIYETLVAARSEIRSAKWRQIVRLLLGVYGVAVGSCKVLVYGDSVGSDSIYLRRLGFDVYYHDVDSTCSRFAFYRFEKRGLHIKRFAPGVEGQAFDVVICLEVAEHVPDPPALVAEIKQILKPDGLCFFSEAFALLQDRYPTHLRSNEAFAGCTDELFLRQGLYPCWRDVNDKPIVYSFDPFLRYRYDGHRFSRPYGWLAGLYAALRRVVA